MADNQKPSQSGQKKRSRKKSHIKDGVVLKVSDIERECQRLRKRPRAALYPLLPITEPLKLKRKSIHLQKGRRRHRKHCRKRLKQGGGPVGRRRLLDPTRNSRTRLVATTTTSGSEVSSLACSKNQDLIALHNQQRSSLNKPHWASAELFAVDSLDPPPRTPYLLEHPRHHHYHNKKHKQRICHHDPLLCGHRTSVTTSLKDLRRTSRITSRHRRLDPEAAEDKDSVSSNSRSRKIVSFIVMSVASFILLMCVALVAVTLRLTPAIDELVRKGNEDIYRSMSAGASTSSPTTDGAGAVNSSTPSSGTPG